MKGKEMKVEMKTAQMKKYLQYTNNGDCKGSLESPTVEERSVLVILARQSIRLRISE